MTYKVGDDATITYPVTDTATPPGTLNFTPIVTARKSDDIPVTVDGAAWLGSAASTRDLEVPLGDLPTGLWSLRLTITGGPDLFLGNVYIE